MSYLNVSQVNAGVEGIYISFNFPPGSYEYSTFTTKKVRAIVLVTERTKEQLANQTDTSSPQGYLKYNAVTDVLFRSTTFNLNDGPVVNSPLSLGGVDGFAWQDRPNLFIGIVDESYTYIDDIGQLGAVGASTFIITSPELGFTQNDVDVEVAFNGFNGNGEGSPYTWRLNKNTNSYIFYTQAISTPTVAVSLATSGVTTINDVVASMDASTIDNQPFSTTMYAYDLNVSNIIPASVSTRDGLEDKSTLVSYGFLMNGLTPSTEYFFKAQITDARGFTSGVSALSGGGVTTLAPPPNFGRTPTNVNLAYTNPSQPWLGFTVTWTLPEQVINDLATGSSNSNNVYYRIELIHASQTQATFITNPSSTSGTIGAGYPYFILSLGDYYASVVSQGYADESPLTFYRSEDSNTLTLTQNTPPPPPSNPPQWINPQNFTGTVNADASTNGVITLNFNRLQYTLDNITYNAQYYTISGYYFDSNNIKLYLNGVNAIFNSPTETLSYAYGSHIADSQLNTTTTYYFDIYAFTPNLGLNEIPINNQPLQATSSATTPAPVTEPDDYFELHDPTQPFPNALALSWTVPPSNGLAIDYFVVTLTPVAPATLSFTYTVANAAAPGHNYLLTVMREEDAAKLTSGQEIFPCNTPYGSYLGPFAPDSLTQINLPQYYGTNGVLAGTYNVKITSYSAQGVPNPSAQTTTLILTSRRPCMPKPLGVPTATQSSVSNVQVYWGEGVTGATGPDSRINVPTNVTVVAKVYSGSTGPQIKTTAPYVDPATASPLAITGLDPSKTYDFCTYFELNGVTGQQGSDSNSLSFQSFGLSAIPQPAGTVLGPDGTSLLVYWTNGPTPSPGYTAGPTGYDVTLNYTLGGGTYTSNTVDQYDFLNGDNLASFSWNAIWAEYSSDITPPPIPTNLQTITTDPTLPLGIFWTIFDSLPYETFFKTSIVASTNNSNVSPVLNLPSVFTALAPVPPPPPPCFVSGTQILTDEGYKTVETLVPGEDLVMTSDGRAVTFKLYSRTVSNANTDSAPYRIFAGAFGPNSPPQDVCLSGMHAIQSSDGVWQVPEFVAKKNPMVQQYGLGETVTYYHIECSNFFSDNLVAQGAIVESFRNRQAGNERVLYKFVAELDGFIRVQEDEVIPVELEKMALSVM
jgi:hypothetical protein